VHDSGDKRDVIPAATSVRRGSRPLGGSRSMDRWKDDETKAPACSWAFSCGGPQVVTSNEQRPKGSIWRLHDLPCLHCSQLCLRGDHNPLSAKPRTTFG
jgi:hypothetical protein